MNEFLRRNPLIAGLAALCVLLAVVIAVEVFALRAGSAPAGPRKAAPAEVKLLPPLAAASPEAAYPETAARPLWIPTRRPAPPAATVATQTFTRGQFTLHGVTIAGSTRIALLKEKASGRMHRVELGRDVNGLHLAEVEPERVTLTQGGEREVIELRVQRGPAAPQTAAGAPAAAQPAAPAPAQSAAASAAGVSTRSGPFTPPPVSPAPGGIPLIPPGPMPPSAMPPSTPTAPANPANPPGTAPQQSAAPMTPEELLARRRARRNQPSE